MCANAGKSPRAPIEKLEREGTAFLAEGAIGCCTVIRSSLAVRWAELKFTSAGGNVVVKVYAEAGCVCLDVADSGIGIPSQELECILSGFYQVDGSTRRKYGGLGLGLTLIKAVAEAHGGWVEAYSQLGQGSRFVVRLPAHGTMHEWIGPAKRQRY